MLVMPNLTVVYNIHYLQQLTSDPFKSSRWTNFKKKAYVVSVNKYHGTITQTGIICKKISCYMCDSVCRWLIVEIF